MNPVLFLQGYQCNTKQQSFPFVFNPKSARTNRTVFQCKCTKKMNHDEVWDIFVVKQICVSELASLGENDKYVVSTIISFIRNY